MVRTITLLIAGFGLIAAFTGPATAAPTSSSRLQGVATLVAADAKPWQCGLPVKKPDGSKWICKFVEHFGGSKLDATSWTVQRSENSGAMPAHACWGHDPRNVSVSGGALKLTVIKEDEPFTCQSAWGEFETQYSGGSVSTWDTLEQTYGRYEIRAKFPNATVSGIHSAIWLTPRNQIYGRWPMSGEIDIAEFYSKYPDRAIPYLHYIHESPDPVTNTQCKLNPRNFNTYTVEWTPGLITIKYNNKVCLTHRVDAKDPLTGSAPFDHPFALVLTQTLGIGQNPFNPATTPLPQTMEVDRVRVWR